MPTWKFFKPGLVVFLALSAILAAQEEPKPVEEYVDVTNVEVIVRALKKGQPQTGLTKADLTLYENGKRMEISSMQEIRRKIGTRSVDLKVEKVINLKREPRLFILYFWITDKKVDYREALDYFFEQVYQKNDMVILALKNKAFKITDPGQLDSTLARFTECMEEYILQASQDMENAKRDVENLTKTIMEQIRSTIPDASGSDFDMNQLKHSYLAIWNKYHNRHGEANYKMLHDLAGALDPLEMEKWGLVFYQHQHFPKIDTQSSDLMVFSDLGRSKRADDSNDRVTYHKTKQSPRINDKLKQTLQKIYRDMAVPHDTLSKIKGLQEDFIHANATFHLLMLDAKTKDALNSANIFMDDVYSEWRDTFEQVSKGTGGDQINANKMKESLQKIVHREDIYYRLTYRPQILQAQNRKIKVVAKDSHLDVYYMSRIKLKPVSILKIKDIEFSNQRLTFTLTNFLQRFIDEEPRGNVTIQVTSYDDQDETQTFTKDLELAEQEVEVTFSLNLPHTGVYRLAIEARDNFTGKTIKLNGKIRYTAPD